MPTIEETLAALQSAALNGKPVDVAAYAKAKKALEADRILAEARTIAKQQQEKDAAEKLAAETAAARRKRTQQLINKARKA